MLPERFWVYEEKCNLEKQSTQPKACNFIKKETLVQVFSCEFNEISKNTFSYRAPPVAASEFIKKIFIWKGKSVNVTKVKLFTKIKKHNKFYFRTLIIALYCHCGDYRLLSKHRLQIKQQLSG